MVAENAEWMWVRERLARRFYLAYCKNKNVAPWREGSMPKWAPEYAAIAMTVLGYDDEGVVKLRVPDEIVVPT